MLRRKEHKVRSDDSIRSSVNGANGVGSGVGNQDGGDTDAPEVCYDAMSSFNVTVSLQPKTPSSPTGGANSIGATQSLGSGSLGRTSFGSTSSTVVSKTPSLAESIGNFDPDKFDKIAKQALVSTRSSDENIRDTASTQQ